MYKIAICDDDKNFISLLKKRIAKANIVDAGCIRFYEFYSGVCPRSAADGGGNPCVRAGK